MKNELNPVKNYYDKQLDKLTDKTKLTVHFSDWSGNKTNHMDINIESVDSFINFLKSEKKRLQKLKD